MSKPASETEPTGSSTPKKKRKVVNRQSDRPGQFLKLRGLFDQPTLWDHAATIPPQSAEGAPRKLPEIVYLAMPSLAAIWGSFSKAETTLGEIEAWRIFCQVLCEMQPRYRPQDEPFDLDALVATSPLTAQNFYDARRSWLASYLDSFGDTFEKHAADAALELGYADPNGPGSVNNLTRTRTLAGDGKVTREPGSRYAALTPAQEVPALRIAKETHVVDKMTGEILAASKMDGDALLYITGDGTPVVGFKTVRLSLRNDETNSTVIVAVKRPATADEAACAVESTLEVAQRLPGVLAVTYDTALRGKHIRRIAREAGLVVVAPVAAKSKATDDKPRVEKNGYVATVPHVRPDGVSCEHEYYHHGGGLHELKLDSRGRKSLVPCDVPTKRVRHNKRSHRMYLEWQVGCSAGLPPGSDPVTIDTLSWSVTDESSTFNVAENLRAFPPGSAAYAEARGWRQTVENDNNQSDSAKVLRRGRSSRPAWNHINEIGWALVQNGIALQRQRQRQAAEREPAAEAPGLHAA